MDSALQYLLCFEGESWVVFGAVEMSDANADALILAMNDSFSEMGYRVKRERGTAINVEAQPAIRRLQREWDFWRGIVTRWREGLEDSIDEDYPVRYQCFAAMEEMVEYVLHMANEGPLSIDGGQVGVAVDEGVSVDWAFASDPPPDSQFKFGPVIANLKSIANALEYDERTLKANNGKAFVWIRRRHSRECSFWFEYESEHEKAKRATNPQN